MSTYHAPLKDMLFVMKELAGLEQVGKLPGFEDATPDTVDGDSRGGREVRHRSARPAQRGRRSRRLEAGRWRHREDADRLQGGVQAVRRQRLERADQAPRARRAGPAAARVDGGRGNVARRQHGVRAVSAADARRDRGARAGRIRRAEGDVSAEDGRRRVDRHDEPDRAAGRLRPRRGAHARGAAAGRQLQAVRPEDFHHLRRTGLHREHHPPGAGAHARPRPKA